MRTTARRIIAPLIIAALAGAGLAACSSGSGDGGKVTITVGNMPTSDKTAELKVFKTQLAAFEKANPDITVKPSTSTWDPQTFQALVSAKKLPDVYSVPFTDIQSLIARGQVADITDEVKADPQASKLSPTLLKVAQAGGKTYGVPTAAYNMGLLYNRALFTKAGLDPDKPPTTWDEVRQDAKTITEKTGVQGFQAMTKDNTGGWILTTMSYAFGGKIESDDGKKATVDNAATKQALEFYQDLRWQDDSFGSNFLVGYDDAMKNFAAGKAGMWVQGADAWGTVVVTDGMAPDDFGLAPLPQGDKGLGTLGGGSIAILAPNADKAKIQAGLKWIDFMNYRQFFDQKTAVSTAKATASDGGAVGQPQLPLFDQATYDKWLGWVKDEINVPRDHFTPYLDSTSKLALVPEPQNNAQEVYGILDNTVQAVLTTKDTDIDAALKDAQSKVTSALG
jgi:multiple sugar transport system substrate-binding protein